jgi:hypothetical protein
MSANNPAVVIGVSAVDSSKQVLQQFDKNVAQTAQNVEVQGQKIITRTSQMSQAFRENTLKITTAAAALGAGVTSLATSFGDLDKAQLSVQTQQVAVARANDTLERSITAVDSAALRLAKKPRKLGKTAS